MTETDKNLKKPIFSEIYIFELKKKKIKNEIKMHTHSMYIMGKTAACCSGSQMMKKQERKIFTENCEEDLRRYYSEKKTSKRKKKKKIVTTKVKEWT